MIELVPALDIIDGKCVRLTKGDYTQMKVYHSDPVDVAKAFEDIGVKRLHLVDLDGAKSKHVVNMPILRTITKNTNLLVDFGGGIKTEDDICRVFEHGASMVTIGSVAITNPSLFLDWLGEYGADKIILGADVKGDRIAINGWKEESDTNVFSFLRKYQEYGVKNVLCTDISRDGTLAGPSLELYKKIRAIFPDLYLIASGGISTEQDIRDLEALGMPSVVLGKSIYEGRIELKKLLNR